MSPMGALRGGTRGFPGLSLFMLNLIN
jgi:hypothetical protein